ncbi:MAG: hypothetical protein D3906_00545 [Candidatus Electrothrix sp. AUS1_2]|nr:hypothetical protein [Candidatus Electrothrix sp. AUS1_2]
MKFFQHIPKQNLIVMGKVLLSVLAFPVLVSMSVQKIPAILSVGILFLTALSILVLLVLYVRMLMYWILACLILTLLLMMLLLALITANAPITPGKRGMILRPVHCPKLAVLIRQQLLYHLAAVSKMLSGIMLKPVLIIVIKGNVKMNIKLQSSNVTILTLLIL